jgi:hypothetical protein
VRHRRSWLSRRTCRKLLMRHQCKAKTWSKGSNIAPEPAGIEFPLAFVEGRLEWPA